MTAELKLDCILSVLGTDTEVRKQLKEALGFRYLTSLFYEIIGHMFKHHLIDVIVNFNFDEILDNVIEEEMGSSEYFKILLNGHCPDYFSDIQINRKLALPVYIKPHGTIQHLGSLQFLDTHYAKNLHGQMHSLLKDILSEKYSDSPGTSTLPVNIITAGYAFNDLDLYSSIKEAFQKERKNYNFYIFDLNSGTDYSQGHKLFEDLLSTIDGEVHYVKLEKTGNNSLGQNFKKLWNDTAANFKDMYSDRFPRSIARHEFLTEMLKEEHLQTPLPLPNKKNLLAIDYEKALDQFKDGLLKRIYIELAICVGQSDGILHMNQLRYGRLAKYFGLYIQKAKGDHDPGRSITDLILRFKGVKEYMKIIDDTFSITGYKKNGVILYDSIYDDLISLVGKPVGEEVYMKGLFRAVCENKLCVINSDFKEYFISPFKDISKDNLLYSDIRWFYKFRKLFRQNDFNVLLCVSEIGEILQDGYYINFIKDNNICVKMILADYRQDRQNETNVDQSASTIIKDQCEVRFMPWELHNKHTYIFLKIDEFGTFSGQGIYYTRRLLSNKVNPIFVDSKHDIDVLFNFFCNYWFNAGLYLEGKSNMSHTEKDLKIHKREFIRSLLDILKN